MVKKKVIVDYRNVPEAVLQLLAEKYPYGYKKAVIKFQNAKGETVSAVPVETEEVSYLVKVSTQLKSMVDKIEVDEDDIDDMGLEDVEVASDGENFGEKEFDEEEDDVGYEDEPIDEEGDDE